MSFRSIGLSLAAAMVIGLSLSGASQAHGPEAYGHLNPWGYYYGYPSYGGEYWLRHHHHYIYRPHNWHWHPDVNGYEYNGWGGHHGGYGPGGMTPHEIGGGPLYYQGESATPAPSTPATDDPFTDDLPEIPELP